MVEVHWRLDIDEQEGIPNYAATLPVEDLWARAVPWTVDGQAALRLEAVSYQRSAIGGQGTSLARLCHFLWHLFLPRHGRGLQRAGQFEPYMYGRIWQPDPGSGPTCGGPAEEGERG
jgi:hypothetical protein